MGDNTKDNAEEANALWKSGVSHSDPRRGFGCMVRAACKAHGIYINQIATASGLTYGQLDARLDNGLLNQDEMRLILNELKKMVKPNAWFDQKKYDAIERKASERWQRVLQEAHIEYPSSDVFTDEEKIELIEDYWRRGRHEKLTSLRIIAGNSIYRILDDAPPALKPAFLTLSSLMNKETKTAGENYDVSLAYIMHVALQARHPWLTVERQNEFYKDWKLTPERRVAAEKIVADGRAPEAVPKVDKILEKLKQEVAKRIAALSSGLPMSAIQLSTILGIETREAKQILNGEQLPTLEEVVTLDAAILSRIIKPVDRVRLQVNEPLAPEVAEYLRSKAAQAERTQAERASEAVLEPMAGGALVSQAAQAEAVTLPLPEARREPAHIELAPAAPTIEAAVPAPVAEPALEAPARNSVKPSSRIQWVGTMHTEPRSFGDMVAEGLTEKGSGGRGGR